MQGVTLLLLAPGVPDARGLGVCDLNAVRGAEERELGYIAEADFSISWGRSICW